jgi:hypothetical protein
MEISLWKTDDRHIPWRDCHNEVRLSTVNCCAVAAGGFWPHHVEDEYFHVSEDECRSVVEQQSAVAAEIRRELTRAQRSLWFTKGNMPPCPLRSRARRFG